IVYFFSAPFRPVRNDHVRRRLGFLRHALHRAIRGIGGGCQDEKDLVVTIIKFSQREEIAFQPWFYAFARTQHRDARRSESRIALHPPPRVLHPAQPMPHLVHTNAYLKDGQVIEQSLHVSPSLAEPIPSRSVA